MHAYDAASICSRRRFDYLSTLRDPRRQPSPVDRRRNTKQKRSSRREAAEWKQKAHSVLAIFSKGGRTERSRRVTGESSDASSVRPITPGCGVLHPWGAPLGLPSCRQWLPCWTYAKTLPRHDPNSLPHHLTLGQDCQCQPCASLPQARGMTRRPDSAHDGGRRGLLTETQNLCGFPCDSFSESIRFQGRRHCFSSISFVCLCFPPLLRLLPSPLSIFPSGCGDKALVITNSQATPARLKPRCPSKTPWCCPIPTSTSSPARKMRCIR